MAESNFFLRSGNVLFSTILRSPLHGLASKSFMLVSVTGRKSGKVYTTPVNYHQFGDALRVVSERKRTWWRNLRGESAKATLRLQGKDMRATARVIEEEQEVAQALVDYLSRSPQNTRYFGVKTGPDGRPGEEDIRLAAKDKVIIEFHLPSPAGPNQ